MNSDVNIIFWSAFEKAFMQQTKAVCVGNMRLNKLGLKTFIGRSIQENTER